MPGTKDAGIRTSRVLSTAALLDATEQSRPADFTKNGWVVEALQGVVAISTTPVPEEDRRQSLRPYALEASVRGGRGETDPGQDDIITYVVIA